MSLHKSSIVFALFLFLAGSVRAAEPSNLELRQENDRLRREVAALKAEVAKLKAELAKKEAAAPQAPAPKATSYTAEQIVKLVPANALPARGEHSPAKYGRAAKILGASLDGEWVRMEAKIRRAEDAGDGTTLQAFTQTTADPDFFTDFRFSPPLPNFKRYEGQTVTVVGKVKSIGLHDQGDAGPHFLMLVTECRIVK